MTAVIISSSCNGHWHRWEEEGGREGWNEGGRKGTNKYRHNKSDAMSHKYCYATKEHVAHHIKNGAASLGKNADRLDENKHIRISRLPAAIT
jgi:hypothetical protein